MATLVKTHVQISGAGAGPRFEVGNDERDSAGGSDDERPNDEASDERESDKDGDGGSDLDEADDEIGGEDEDRDDGNANDRDDGNASAGWAEAMSKILGKKTLESKTSILMKNKQLDKMKAKERQEQLQRQKQIDEKRTWEMMCREKPNIVKDRETERALQRIATRGVVQLFNAVRKHQKTIDERVKEAGSSERKKAKLLSSVSKKDFIDVLRKTEGGRVVTGKTEKNTAAAAEEKPAWSVLRDDFMMGATMKDWDKDSDREEADALPACGSHKSDSD